MEKIHPLLARVGQVLVWACFATTLSAQEVTNWELWSNVTAQLSRGAWQVDLRQEGRYDFTAGELDYTFTELAPAVDVVKVLTISPAIRYYFETRGDDSYRIMLDLSGNYPLGRDSVWFLGWRQRWQQEDIVPEDDFEDETTWRSRFGLGYALTGKLMLTGEAELFYTFDDQHDWSRIRRTLELAWDVSDRWTITTFLRLDRSLNESPITKRYSIGLYGTVRF